MTPRVGCEHKLSSKTHLDTRVPEAAALAVVRVRRDAEEDSHQQAPRKEGDCEAR